MGDGRHVTVAGASSEVDALFTADPDDPVLAANQMIAALEFIHFENAYETDAAGIVGWNHRRHGSPRTSC